MLKQFIKFHHSINPAVQNMHSFEGRSVHSSDRHTEVIMGLNTEVRSLYPELVTKSMEVPLLVNLWVNVVRTLFSAALESFSFVLASIVHGMEVPLPIENTERNHSLQTFRDHTGPEGGKNG